MRIIKTHISNFRCLGDVEVIFDDVTTLIGPNGVGKSTVLHALDWFFNAPLTGGALNEADRTAGSESAEVSVEVEFGDLTSADREALGHYAPAGVETVKLWRYRDDTGNERLTANARAFAPFSAVRSAGNKTAVKAAYAALRTSDVSLGLPSAGTADIALEEMLRWESTHPDQLEEAPQELTTNFFGFNSQGKMSGLFDFVLVKADLRATEQVSDNKTTIIGRILERAIDRTAADAALATLSEEMLDRQQQIFDDNFEEQLTNLSNELTQAVEQYSQGRQISLSNQSLEIKPAKTQFSVSVKDQEIVTSVERQGHGFQRTLLISALQLLANRGSAGTSDGTICLAIEEPELFQHPVQAQAFASVLRRLAEDSENRIQVAYATHSPYFIHPGRFYQVRRLSRGTGANGGTPPVTIKHTTIEAVTASLAGRVRPEVIANQMDSVALHRLPEALFAKTVVLVEGTSDRALIEGISERHDETPLAVQGIVVAEVGGKNNLFLPKTILEEMGIPVYVVFDADNGTEARMTASGKPTSEITAAVAALKNDNKELMQALGEPATEWPSTQVYPNFAVWEDTLEPLVVATWPEWQTKAAEISTEGVGSLKKNQLLYKDVARQAAGEIPEILAQLMTSIRSL